MRLGSGGDISAPAPLGPELRQPASKLNLHSSVEGAISARERRTSVANRNHKLDPLSNGCDVLDARSQWRFQGGVGWERGVEQRWAAASFSAAPVNREVVERPSPYLKCTTVDDRLPQCSCYNHSDKEKNVQLQLLHFDRPRPTPGL